MSPEGGPPTGFSLPEMEARKRWLEQRIRQDKSEVGRLGKAIIALRAAMGRGDRLVKPLEAVFAYLDTLSKTRSVPIDVDACTRYALEMGMPPMGSYQESRDEILRRLTRLAREERGVRRVGQGKYETAPGQSRAYDPEKSVTVRRIRPAG